MPEYVVIGPGWGSEYLQPRGPSGSIEYRGRSRELAEKVLRRCHREVAALRHKPGFANAADTWRLLRWDSTAWGGTGGWVAVEEGGDD